MAEIALIASRNSRGGLAGWLERPSHRGVDPQERRATTAPGPEPASGQSIAGPHDDDSFITDDLGVPPERGIRPAARRRNGFWAIPTSTGLRFRVLRPHAQGGIGKVSVAFDAELQREVALKQIKPERADDADSRGRFLLEAEVTGRLEHPGIVPVYGLGVDDRAGRFMPCGSCEDKAWKRRSGTIIAPMPTHRAMPGLAALELRSLLDRFADVCHTVAYAHSRGVLHRDLKPANILLGPFNESLVVDWGLAKVLGRSPLPDKAAAPTLSSPTDHAEDAPRSRCGRRRGGRPGTATGNATTQRRSGFPARPTPRRERRSARRPS